jgi:hypothetical protein
MGRERGEGRTPVDTRDAEENEERLEGVEEEVERLSDRPAEKDEKRDHEERNCSEESRLVEREKEGRGEGRTLNGRTDSDGERKVEL